MTHPRITSRSFFHQHLRNLMAQYIREQMKEYSSPTDPRCRESVENYESVRQYIKWDVQNFKEWLEKKHPEELGKVPSHD